MAAGEENAPPDHGDGRRSGSAPATLSERVEGSPAGRVLISVAIVLLLLAQVGTHLPTGSALHRSVEGHANAAVRLVASEQQWGVFAPDPRTTSLRIEANVTFADGTTAVWTLPEGARIGANLRYYRWRKWLERVRSEDFRGLWEPTARWIAGEYADRPSPVVKVELVRLFHKNSLQGEPLPYQSAVYFTYEPDRDEGGS
jgi:hypothetical protein